MDLVEELKIENLEKYLIKRMLEYKALVDEPLPDWYNMHDYSSGFYNGRKIAAQDKIDLINEILDRLEELNG